MCSSAIYQHWYQRGTSAPVPVREVSADDYSLPPPPNDQNKAPPRPALWITA
ncbi:hypothetical protein J6590_069635 [Homalodisca vitripennis]|nr:hypothetical protein J6590_069635 [Homalodisca vitripennis]